jgi:Zn-finger nucleic acid-binding protein
MENEKFLKLDKIADDVHDKFKKLNELGEFDEIKEKIQEVLKSIPEKYSIDLGLSLAIHDLERIKTIDIYSIGLTGIGQEPKMFEYGDGYQFNRYLSNGNIVEIPHSYCPNCWGDWDFKSPGDSCPDCNVTFGKEVKLLLDSNECPNCENGKVSQTNPYCDSCDFEASDDIVIWG